MRLTDLGPTLKGAVEDGTLLFKCPHAACDHYLQIHISGAPYHERERRPGEKWFEGNKYPKVKVWQASGEFPDSLTLTPSINVIDEKSGQTTCWHGFITNGEIR